MRHEMFCLDLAILLALAAGLGTYSLLAGVPGELTLSLGGMTIHWSPSRGHDVVAGAAVGCATLVAFGLCYGAARGIWTAAGLVAAWLAAPDGPARTPAFRAIVAVVLGAAVLSAVIGNALAIVALLAAVLIVLAGLVMQRALAGVERLWTSPGLRSRTSAIGGGQAEWLISPTLLMVVLALALAAGAVTLAAVAVLPHDGAKSAPPAAATPHDAHAAGTHPGEP